LKNNFKRNRFLFWKALETYVIGVMFIIRQNTISFYPPRPSLLMYFDDPPFIFFMGIVGTSNATAGITLHSAGDLNVYRDQATGGNLTAVAGTLTYMV